MLLFLVLCCFRSRAEQFVEITAQIEVSYWAFWYDRDDRRVPSHEGDSLSLSRAPNTIRCVVGDNIWMMETETHLRNARTTWWFTGTNIIEHSITIRSNPPVKIGTFTTSNIPVGHKWTRLFESQDGNPGQPVRVVDQLDVDSRICWLAFCSGPVLNQPRHKIYPPSSIWKAIVNAPNGFIDSTITFSNTSGLPRKMELRNDHGQLAVQYKANQFTNVLGRDFPLEFNLVQYRPPHDPNTNSWELDLVAKGRVTSIRPTEPFAIPGEVLKAVGK